MSSCAATVFVVDDDLSIRRSLTHLFGAAGLNVAVFASAQEFLERYNASAPGCLVLDLAMPGLNGLELQEMLAARGSRLPIIFLTGHGDLPSGLKALKSGAADFLTKPVDATDLIDAVRGAEFERLRVAAHHPQRRMRFLRRHHRNAGVVGVKLLAVIRERLRLAECRA